MPSRITGDLFGHLGTYHVRYYRLQWKVLTEECEEETPPGRYYPANRSIRPFQDDVRKSPKCEGPDTGQFFDGFFSRAQAPGQGPACVGETATYRQPQVWGCEALQVVPPPFDHVLHQTSSDPSTSQQMRWESAFEKHRCPEFPTLGKKKKNKKKPNVPSVVQVSAAHLGNEKATAAAAEWLRGTGSRRLSLSRIGLTADATGRERTPPP
ncbi:hypothetical protein CPLU01_05054 [Colletotrichum plurivorum]|uniref:Uncharacterized protein n=1 Tax=Colletotrichum plurivorum TaxID=2175906 RepID=A0A8H6NIN1_9PEZI|nr:hypothetical protein CPLU01_05054 [Colletotrichum plurivorum]